MVLFRTVKNGREQKKRGGGLCLLQSHIFRVVTLPELARHGWKLFHTLSPKEGSYQMQTILLWTVSSNWRGKVKAKENKQRSAHPEEETGRPWEKMEQRTRPETKGQSIAHLEVITCVWVPPRTSDSFPLTGVLWGSSETLVMRVLYKL